MKSSATRKRLRGVDAVILHNNILRLVAIPELGGKIVSLIRLQSGYEFLLQSEDQREYHRPAYGRDFENGDVSGFDECVPTVPSRAILRATVARSRRCLVFARYGRISWGASQVHHFSRQFASPIYKICATGRKQCTA
jgi:hypothetical protein